MITVQKLKKHYEEIKAVDDISFEVAKGEIVGFLGPNGAGKTTTMKILTGYIGSTSGQASIAGHDVEKEPLEIKKRIGYLPENAPLYMDMDVTEYLRFIAETREIEKKEITKKIKEMIDVCGLEKVIRRPIANLSKGYRQRVGLAQAMIHNPDVLILDEPTSGLDPNQIIEIRELIKRIGKEKTVILSTHILPEVSATCDRAIIINEGKIVAKGTLDELASNKKSIVTATIKASKDEIQNKFESASFIDTFQNVGEKGNYFSYEISPQDNKNINEDIFNMAVQNNWILTELKSEGASLEDVFTQLTRSEK